MQTYEQIRILGRLTDTVLQIIFKAKLIKEQRSGDVKLSKSCFQLLLQVQHKRQRREAVHEHHPRDVQEHGDTGQVAPQRPHGPR